MYDTKISTEAIEILTNSNVFRISPEEIICPKNISCQQCNNLFPTGLLPCPEPVQILNSIPNLRYTHPELFI